MSIIYKKEIRRILFTFSLFLIFCSNLFTQTTTTIQGTIRDSVSGEPVSFATVRFDNSTIGNLSEDNGKYKLTNRLNKNVVVFSLMGYNTKTVKIPAGKITTMDILLVPEGVNLNEIVVRPKKQKYSKKNNPAVELIKKVIDHKNDYTIASQNYYNSQEYDRIFFALNEFDANKGQFKKMKYLEDYTAKSRIDDKKILPFSVRETVADVYYRKDPSATRRIIKAHKSEGLDQGMNQETLDGIINETFKTVNITDNNIHLLLQDFVGPLNSHISVDFYKWYIIDTINIEKERYINLGFVPFNTRDVGFSGNIYVTTDSTYAIKKISMRVPTKTNINFVKEMLITQEFEKLSSDLWIPKEFITAIDLSLYNTFKLYVEKVKNFDHFKFNQPVELIFSNPAPEIYLSDYKKKDKEFWDKNRPPSFNEDYKMDEMMDNLMSNKFVKYTLAVGNILSSQYIPTSTDEEKNKLDIGTPLTFFSYNRLEGGRFRITGTTNKNFHPHLYLYGYAAYGLKDKKFKYLGEVTWAFNRRNYHKDEFPKNNFSLSYKNDVNALGQHFLQAERDDILMSLSASKNEKLTYDKIAKVDYIKEYYNGFSFNIFAQNHIRKRGLNVTFEHINDYGQLDTINNIKTTEAGLILRYAHNESFFQQKRKRRSLPSKGFIYTLAFSAGFKDFMGGQYEYQKLSLSINKQWWVAPLGRITTNIQGEKIWGKVPYPLLLSANANSSYTVQKGSFYLLEPMEFINDSQLTWDVNWRMGGWLFNRIPVIKLFKWREILGFRGFIGDLSKKNNPVYDQNLIMFPEDSFSMGGKPYMEYTIGIENIFQFFRIDYVRRLSFLNNPNINKDGFRITFDMRF